MNHIQRAFLQASTGSTDKVAHHGYHRFYAWFLAPFRDKPVRLLEIGLGELGSVQLWKRYFTAGIELHGIDIHAKSFRSGDVTLHQVDQGDAGQLAAFASGVGGAFDIVVDDGSHVPAHQLLTLRTLWPIVAAGGIYILEDIETAYWGRSTIYGYLFDSRRASENVLRQLSAAVDAVNAEFLSPAQQRAIDRHPLRAVLREVEMISYGHNCIVIVKKDSASFSRFYDRPYRFEEMIMFRHPLHRRVRRLRELGAGGSIRHAWRLLRRLAR